MTVSDESSAVLLPVRRVAVAGAGILGSQIAVQSAVHGYDVAVYDADEESRTRAPETFSWIADQHSEDIDADPDKLTAGLDRLSLHSDLAAAVEDVDLVIEAIPEVFEIKRDFLIELNAASPDRAIFASNSSGIVPSQLAEYSGRPARYLHMHFSNRIWKHNVAEVMGSPSTSAAVYDSTVAFARSIGMVPIQIRRENPGYIGNALLAPLLDAALRLVIEGVADPETVDKNWMITRETPFGPFAMYDFIGFRTMRLRAAARYEDDPSDYNAKVLALWDELIDQGKLGEASGEGFYSYPGPVWKDPDFLT